MSHLGRCAFCPTSADGWGAEDLVVHQCWDGTHEPPPLLVALSLPELALVSQCFLDATNPVHVRRDGDRLYFTFDNADAEYVVTEEHTGPFGLPSYDVLRAARLYVHVKDDATVLPRLGVIEADPT